MDFFKKVGLVCNTDKHTKVALIVIILIMVAMVMTIFALVILIVRATRREVHLCAAYMRQMDKTSQAERKSLKQSLAFASINHDLRGYLGCIKVLIELCYSEVSLSSTLASHIKNIDASAEELLALVNSILDFSKIEAGKMQLEVEHFDLTRLLENIADLHHSVAMKKGVEVILDPCNGSVLKYSHVRGDQGKLKQILSNLLNNARKFTPSGHISIRAWARKPSLENSIIASNKNNLLNRVCHFFYNNKQAYNDLEEMRTIKQNSNYMEFVFEVEDTGVGIPKDKRECIFENFVQVNDNSAGQLGTGLGLGIVQSLVRLMGGDIEIVDKANGEDGTCFRFNTILNVTENSVLDSLRKVAIEHQDTYRSSETRTCADSPKSEGSMVVLFMKDDERRKVIQRYIGSLGIKLVVVSQVNEIPHVVQKVSKPMLMKLAHCYSSSSRGFSSSPRDGAKLFPLNLWDAANDSLPVSRTTSSRGTTKCIMLIVDANEGNFQELCRSVAQLRKDHSKIRIMVVWLERPAGLADESLPWTDCVVQKPLHGSRLFQVIELLPEFGGEHVMISRKKRRFNTVFPNNIPSEIEEIGSSKSEGLSRTCSLTFSCDDGTGRAGFMDTKSLICGRSTEIEELDNTSCKKSSTLKKIVSYTKILPCPLVNETRNTNKSLLDSSKPLEGKRFLLVDDSRLGRDVAARFIIHLGGQAEVCENGIEAVELICKALDDLCGDHLCGFSYDYVLMDCQMPIMDGYEATRRIREVEKKHGIHIPVIALTAGEAEEEKTKIVEAGMDFHMTKPLKKEELVKAMRLICI